MVVCACEQGCHYPDLVGHQHHCGRCNRGVHAMCFATNHDFHDKPDEYFCGAADGTCCVEYSKPHPAPLSKVPTEKCLAPHLEAQARAPTQGSQAGSTNENLCAAGSACMISSSRAHPPRSRMRCCGAWCHLMCLAVECRACLGIEPEEKGPSDTGGRDGGGRGRDDRDSDDRGRGDGQLHNRGRDDRGKDARHDGTGNKAWSVDGDYSAEEGGQNDRASSKGPGRTWAQLDQESRNRERGLPVPIAANPRGRKASRWPGVFGNASSSVSGGGTPSGGEPPEDDPSELATGKENPAGSPPPPLPSPEEKSAPADSNIPNPYEKTFSGKQPRRSSRTKGRPKKDTPAPETTEPAPSTIKLDGARMYQKMATAAKEAIGDFMSSKPYVESLAGAFGSPVFDTLVGKTLSKAFKDRTKEEQKQLVAEVKKAAMDTHKDTTKGVFDKISETNEKNRKSIEKTTSLMTDASKTMKEASAFLAKKLNSDQSKGGGGPSVGIDEIAKELVPRVVQEVQSIAKAERSNATHALVTNLVPVVVREVHRQLSEASAESSESTRALREATALLREAAAVLKEAPAAGRLPTTPPSRGATHRRQPKRKSENAPYSPTSGAWPSTPGSGRGGAWRYSQQQRQQVNGHGGPRTELDRFWSDTDSSAKNTRAPLHSSTFNAGGAPTTRDGTNGGRRQEPRTQGRQEPRTQGRQEPRTQGRQEPRTQDRQEPRTQDRQEPRTQDRQEPRTQDRQEPRTQGRQEPRAEDSEFSRWSPACEPRRQSFGGRYD